MRDPLAFLRYYGRYLCDGGTIVVSIPNVRYYKIIIRLVLGGAWDYMETGILDKSHLRFFTLVNIKELLGEAGYGITRIERNIVAASGFKILNFLLFNLLQDFLCYQYYIVARKTKNASACVNKRKKYLF